MGAAAATIAVEAIPGALDKKTVRTIHRRIAPEFIVRESTRSGK